jgi:hypothetical protein
MPRHLWLGMKRCLPQAALGESDKKTLTNQNTSLW